MRLDGRRVGFLDLDRRGIGQGLDSIAALVLQLLAERLLRLRRRAACRVALQQGLLFGVRRLHQVRGVTGPLRAVGNDDSDILAGVVDHVVGQRQPILAGLTAVEEILLRGSQLRDVLVREDGQDARRRQGGRDVDLFHLPLGDGAADERRRPVIAVRHRVARDADERDPPPGMRGPPPHFDHESPGVQDMFAAHGPPGGPGSTIFGSGQTLPLLYSSPESCATTRETPTAKTKAVREIISHRLFDFILRKRTRAVARQL